MMDSTQKKMLELNVILSAEDAEHFFFFPSVCVYLVADLR